MDSGGWRGRQQRAVGVWGREGPRAEPSRAEGSGRVGRARSSEQRCFEEDPGGPQGRERVPSYTGAAGPHCRTEVPPNLSARGLRQPRESTGTLNRGPGLPPRHVLHQSHGSTDEIWVQNCFFPLLCDRLSLGGCENEQRRNRGRNGPVCAALLQVMDAGLCLRSPC